ncbi:tripartite motif containing 35-28 [Neolamprologus brichardi]|uniref:tripartite motif containing 35-28 n=1 Tax=Neolamprologus brichardi TaxID=32507 RepID=UPI001643E79C|nr:tripartite motif containing 35-28 [Neolamprologus brichardi]
MSDNMDEDEPLPLQQDLTCPICQGIFRDPMLLPCTHSFCRECLEENCKHSKTCPVCRVVCDKDKAIANRALNSTCESFLKQTNKRPKTIQSSEAVCNLHLKPLELYCEKDEEPVCVDCVPLHSTHRLYTLSDGAPMCKSLYSSLLSFAKLQLSLINFTHCRLLSRAHWSRSEPRLPYGSLLNVAKHVGGLGFNVWKKMQSHVKYYPVLLNPNTASPWLSLSSDLVSVKESSERLTVPDNPYRFDPCVFVLGAEGYTSGKHKWDVLVGDNPKWIVGVCRESLPRKKKFTVATNRGVWALGLSKGVYNVMTTKREELQLQQRPEKIRVKLNMEKGEVSFWDGGLGKHLVTLTHKFEGVIFPIFGPGLHSSPMALVPGKIAIHMSTTQDKVIAVKMRD